MKRLNKIIGDCHVCKDEKSTFKFKGIMSYQGKRVFDIYTCEKCGNTQSFNFSDWYRYILKTKII